MAKGMKEVKAQRNEALKAQAETYAALQHFEAENRELAPELNAMAQDKRNYIIAGRGLFARMVSNKTANLALCEVIAKLEAPGGSVFKEGFGRGKASVLILSDKYAEEARKGDVLKRELEAMKVEKEMWEAKGEDLMKRCQVTRVVSEVKRREIEEVLSDRWIEFLTDREEERKESNEKWCEFVGEKVEKMKANYEKALGEKDEEIARLKERAARGDRFMDFALKEVSAAGLAEKLSSLEVEGDKVDGEYCNVREDL